MLALITGWTFAVHSSCCAEVGASWTIQLSSIGNEAADSTGQAAIGHVVRDVAASPDGRWIAAIVGHRGRSCESRPDDLFLVPVNGSIAQAKSLRLSRCAYARTSKPLHWSPGASHLAIVLGGYVTVLTAAGRLECQIGPVASFAGFVDDERMIAAMPRGSGPGPFSTRPAPVSIYTPTCELKATWQYPRKISRIVVAGPPAIGMVYEEDGSAVLLNPLTGTVLNELPKMAYNPMFLFGDRGRVLCVAHQPAGKFNVQMSCYESSRGSEVLPRPAVRNGAPFDVAWDSPVLVATDGYLTDVPFSFDTRLKTEAWIVWDMRRGACLARIKQRKQMQSFKDQGTAAKATLLPNGQRLAIGADDTLSLFNIAAPAEPD